MKLKIESVVIVVNNLMSKQQYGAARDIIQKEWKRITEPLHFHLLGGEAKELVKVIAKENQDKDFSLLSEKDKRILNLLNEAVREVKLPYAKKIFLEHKELFDQGYAQNGLHLMQGSCVMPGIKMLDMNPLSGVEMYIALFLSCFLLHLLYLKVNF